MEEKYLKNIHEWQGLTSKNHLGQIFTNKELADQEAAYGFKQWLYFQQKYGINLIIDNTPVKIGDYKLVTEPEMITTPKPDPISDKDLMFNHDLLTDLFKE